MEIKDRVKLVNRICSGFLFSSINYKGTKAKVRFNDPKIDLLTEADFIYSTIYEESVESGVMTLDESFDILKQDKKWSDELEVELHILQKNTEDLQLQLSTYRFHKNNQKIIKKTIQSNEKRIEELEKMKNQLFSSTAEYTAEMGRKRFIIRNITKVENESLLNNQGFVNSLIVCYYRENSIDNKKIRELARSDPWRTYWTVSKQTGTSLFPHSCVEMTEYQYALVSWTKVYDFAFESDNRPTDDVLEDDDQFDGWYKAEVDRILKEIKKNQNDYGKNSVSSNSSNKIGRSEVFIPADAEGSREVYDLNDPIARSNIKQRQKLLEEKGVCREDEMPDTKMEIKMGLNRLAMEKGTKSG